MTGDRKRKEIRNVTQSGSGLRLLPWGIAPFLLAPRAGALADRIGERVLAVAGLLLQAAGLAWIAAVAAPGAGYPALIAPMAITGAGFGVAPAVPAKVPEMARPLRGDELRGAGSSQ